MTLGQAPYPTRRFHRTTAARVVRIAHPPAGPSPALDTGVGSSGPTLRLERLLWSQGISRVAGIDEAGRGAWAGPVVAAAVVFPPRDRLGAEHAPGAEEVLTGIRDSKQLSAAQRGTARSTIEAVALGVGVGVAPREVVDELGLAAAGQLAFWRAVQALPLRPEYLLVDGFPLWSDAIPQAAVLQGDQHCLSIAAASIIAKVHRDRIMRELDTQVPGYGFAHNSGYGTAAHRQALATLGPSRFHRRSFLPVVAAAAGLQGGAGRAEA